MHPIKYIEGQKIRTVAGPHGASLLDTSLAAGIPHYHTCGGVGKCSTCRVLVVEGIESFTPRTAKEAALAASKRWPAFVRLACQSHLNGAATVRRFVRDDVDADMVSGETAGLPSSEELEVAILFCDIERFTSIAGQNLAYDITHALNRFFKQIGDPILANGGIIHRYLGDGLLALFGIDGMPRKESSLRAVRAGLRMQSATQTLNDYLREHFGFTFEVRIGAHFGRVLIGRVGHPEKLDFTVIGDAVNIASKIEAANKEYGTRFLVSDELVDPIRESLRFGRDLGPSPLSGQEKLTQLHEILGFQTVDCTYFVQSTFEKIAPNADFFAKTFYHCLFKRRPELESQFAKTDMLTMRRMLMRMIGLTVRGLPEVSPQLVDLGARHVTYGVRREDYADAEEALIYALRAHLGSDFVAEVEKAWRVVFRSIRDAMLRGAV
jgi:class 3 adenylate cyclase/hemoglobin-like flavoprotein